jgi:hypothetical protein
MKHILTGTGGYDHGGFYLRRSPDEGGILVQ